MPKRRVKHGPIGLDIGSTGIRMLQLTDDGQSPAVVAAAHCELPVSPDDADERADSVRQCISDALRHRPFKGRRVVTALGSGEFQIKNIRLPHMPDEELVGAIEFEAGDRFESPPEGLRFQHIVAGEVRHGNEMKDEIIVFGALNSVIQERLALLTSLRLDPVAIDVTPCGVAGGFVRFLRRGQDAAAVNVFLDLGWGATAVVITRGTELVFVKMIDVGGRKLNKAVMKSLGVSAEEAAALRLQVMRNASGRRAEDQNDISPDMQSAVADAVRPLVESLGRELQLCLRYFAVTFRGHPPGCITFVGGEAHEPMLQTVIAEGCGVECTIGNPLRGVDGAEQINSRDRRTSQPAWSVATGLALRGSAWITTPGGGGGGAVSAPRRTAVTV